MIKVLLFDIDGVLIRIQKYFSKVLEERGYIKAPEELDKYYGSDHDCTSGKADPLIEVQKYLLGFGWEKTAKDYFDEQFMYEMQYLDIEMLEKIRNLRRMNITCFLATDQNHYRKRFLLSHLGLENEFDGWFVSSELGYRKIENGFWEFALSSLFQNGIVSHANDILFIDDRKANLDKASEYGIKGFLANEDKEIEKLYEVLSDIASINSYLEI